MAVRLKPILPKTKFNPAKLDREVNRAIMQSLETGKKLFKQTTRNFRTVDVVFVIDPPKNFRGSVGTDEPIYGYVTRGTRPHLITPVRAKVLVFGSGKYNPVTRPGVLGSRRVGVGLQGTGGVAKPVFAKRVRHPGTKARGFEELVAKKLQPSFGVSIQAALLKASS